MSFKNKNNSYLICLPSFIKSSYLPSQKSVFLWCQFKSEPANPIKSAANFLNLIFCPITVQPHLNRTLFLKLGPLSSQEREIEMFFLSFWYLFPPTKQKDFQRLNPSRVFHPLLFLPLIAEPDSDHILLEVQFLRDGCNFFWGRSRLDSEIGF